MKVLAHYDSSGNHVYGVWWINEDTANLNSKYLDPDSPEAARGKVIVRGKTNLAVSWNEWFDQLTTRAPYSEDWVVYDSMGMTGPEFLDALIPSSDR